MTVQVGEDDDDIGNVEAWAVIIEDLLHSVPPEQRAEVLALAVKKEEANRKEREKHGGIIIWDAAEMLAKMHTDPGIRHWNAIMRLKSLIVQVLVRNISNNHSPRDAARLLFAPHRHGHGSGLLQDYLDGLNPDAAEAGK
jgi:hypothetical protein